MDEITIRTATTDDISTLMEFEQGVISAERPFDQCFKNETIHYYDLDSLVHDENTELVVAQVGNEVIASGYAKIVKAKPYVQYVFYSYLGFMYVVPKYRGRGINQLIIKALASWSREQGIFNLHLDVYANNHTAINAYEKVGFSPSLVEMRLSLED